MRKILLDIIFFRVIMSLMVMGGVFAFPVKGPNYFKVSMK